MGKKMEVILVIFIASLILLILGSFTYYSYSYKPIKALAYKESTENVVNPDRGFYIQISTSEADRLEELKTEEVNIVLAAYDIKNFLNGPLDTDKLLELETFLKKATDLQIKVIFRAAYDFYGNYKDPDSMDIIFGHIAQISTILNQYKDTVLAVQAGFLGPWGEWHGSVYLKEEEDGIKNGNKILKLLLNSLDKEIMINVRKPQFIRDAKRAGINTDRVGIHNDAFLSTEDDMGTYSNPDYDRETELKWMEEWIVTGVNGGEMPLVSKNNDVSNAINEMIKMKASYLNCKYNSEVLEKWKQEEYKGVNAFEYIKGHLGYRISLKNSNMPYLLRNGHKINLEITMQNTGFAPISSNYKQILVIKKGEERKEYPIESFLLSKLKNGQNDSFKFELDLPEDFVVEDEVKIGICVKRASDSQIETDMSFVRLANDNIDYEENVNYFATYKKIEKKNLTVENNLSIKEKMVSLFKRLVADSVYYELVE